MKLQFTTKLFKKRENPYSKGKNNRVVRHWLFLLTLFFILLCAVGVIGFFLYRHFILGTGTFFNTQVEQKTPLDEKKLKAIIERFEKRTLPSQEGGTSTPRFIDPSVPF